MLVIFVLEVVLKLTEHFWAFWATNWNVTDFIVTLFCVVFELLRYTNTVSRSRVAFSVSNRPIVLRWLGSRVVSVLDSGAEGPGFKSQPRRCRVTVLGKLFTPVVPLFTMQRNW